MDDAYNVSGFFVTIKANLFKCHQIPVESEWIQSILAAWVTWNGHCVILQ